MEDGESLKYEKYLISDENEDVEKVEKVKSKCCLFYLFCCCCCYAEDKEISKSYYINKWRKYLVC